MSQSLCLQSPRLQVPLQVWQKLMAYVINCPTEVNGFGLVDVIHPELFVVRDIIITEQIAGPAHVEVDPAVIGALMTDMIQRGENPAAIKLQWHSHVNFNAYFSQTDLDNIERWPGDWLISVVANQRGEYECRLDVLGSVRLGVALRPEIVTAIDPAVMAATAQEVADKVKRPSPILGRPRSITDGEPVAAGTQRLGEPGEDVVIVGGDS